MGRPNAGWSSCSVDKAERCWNIKWDFSIDATSGVLLKDCYEVRDLVLLIVTGSTSARTSSWSCASKDVAQSGLLQMLAVLLLSISKS